MALADTAARNSSAQIKVPGQSLGMGLCKFLDSQKAIVLKL
jgi:hypothetical protein